MFVALLLLGLRDFREARSRHRLTHLTQTHHIIPKEFKRHRLLRNVDVDAGENLMLMPNREGSRTLRTKRPCHDGGHPRYNLYVHGRLQQLRHRPGAERESVLRLASELKQRLRSDDVCWP